MMLHRRRCSCSRFFIPNQKDETMRKPSVPTLSENGVMARVRSLLLEEKPAEARTLLAANTTRSPEETNALGVCLLRLGKYADAVQLYRGLVLPGGGVVTTADIPVVWRLNFATALLGDGNLDGFLTALHGIQEHDHPEATRLFDSYHQWKQSLSFGQKLCWRLGISQPARLPVLPVMPGTI